MPTSPKLLVLSLLLAACGDQGRFCTEIGCSSQVEVRLASPASLPYSVTLQVDGEQLQFTCDASGTLSTEVIDCSSNKFILLGSPRVLQVTLEDASGIRSTSSLTPTYQTLQPNGPGCEPICEQASLTLP